MSTTLHCCILGQQKDISFFRVYMIVYIIKRIACLICNLQEDVCFIIKS